MSIHNEAKNGDIAESVLLAGDPLRAKFLAENYLQDAVCYNNIRNMLGYTGTYNGKRVSVQGTGMGIPSMSIYAYELINQYNVKQLVRIGTCGSFQASIRLQDMILAMGASTDSAINKRVFNNADFAAIAEYELLKKAEEASKKLGLQCYVGNVLTSDSFYTDQPPLEYYNKWLEYGILAVEMETAALYSLGARYDVDTLAILTVSDNLVTGEHASTEERQVSYDHMIKIALEIV
jgi:purine-nucleoside phosphorylase